MWELWEVEISAFPLTWHIAYTTTCRYRTSRDMLLLAYRGKRLRQSKSREGETSAVDRPLQGGMPVSFFTWSRATPRANFTVNNRFEICGRPVSARWRHNDVMIASCEDEEDRGDVMRAGDCGICRWCRRQLHRGAVWTRPTRHSRGYERDKCTKHQFIHLLMATCNEWHIENSKNHKKVISLTITSPNCQCAVE